MQESIHSQMMEMRTHQHGTPVQRSLGALVLVGSHAGEHHARVDQHHHAHVAGQLVHQLRTPHLHAHTQYACSLLLL